MFLLARAATYVLKCTPWTFPLVKNLCHKKILIIFFFFKFWWKKFVKNIFSIKIFWHKKKFRSNKFLCQKNSQSKKILIKKFSVQKHLVNKKILWNQSFDKKKIVWSKIKIKWSKNVSGPKRFFVEKIR